MVFRFVSTAISSTTLLFLLGCSAEPQAEAPAGLEITLTAVYQEDEGCRIERVARHDQAIRPLYMVRGEGRYSLADGQRKRIPVQIQFRSEQGVAEDTSITLTDFAVPCDQVAIEWQVEECQAVDRSIVPCPPIQVLGQEAFRAVEIQMIE